MTLNRETSDDEKLWRGWLGGTRVVNVSIQSYMWKPNSFPQCNIEQVKPNSLAEQPFDH